MMEFFLYLMYYSIFFFLQVKIVIPRDKLAYRLFATLS